MQVRKGDTLILDREEFLDPANPSLPIAQATSAMLQRRQPQGFASNSVEVAKATGLPDASNHACITNRRIRQRNLEELLAHTSDPVERAALETRISQLNILRQWWDLTEGGKPIDRRAHQLRSEGARPLAPGLLAGRLGRRRPVRLHLRVLVGAMQGRGAGSIARY